MIDNEAFHILQNAYTIKLIYFYTVIYFHFAGVGVSR